MKLNPQDVHLNTPLHFCCNNGHMESATLLMIVSGCYDYHHVCILVYLCVCLCVYMYFSDFTISEFLYMFIMSPYA